MIEIKNKDGKVLAKVDAETLNRADLRKANLREADLRGADLRWANLQWADLRGADLSRSNLRGALLGSAILCEANLSGADLSWSSLFQASLRGANVHEANLESADLRQADLRCKQNVCAISAGTHTIVAIDDDVKIYGIRKPLAEWLETYESLGEGYLPSTEIAEYGVWLKAIDAIIEVRKIAAREGK